ncbi:unnamed protein product, partial [Laminaria digitata]
AAATEYLAEYDRGEVATQAALRIMRRSGIVAGVNAPPVPVEDPPLETASILLLRLKRRPRQYEKISVVGAERGGKQLLLPPPGGGSRNVAQVVVPSRAGENHRQSQKNRHNTDEEHRKEAGGEGEGKGERQSPTGTTAAPTAATAATDAATAAANKRQGATVNSRGKGGLKNRGGRKRSSGAFEVDLLRFRAAENIRGWKLGAPGGECLASDFSNGACPRLTVLRLGWCLIGDRGAHAIVRSLCGGGGAAAAGRTLKLLDLRGNAITSLGAGTLGDALAAGGLPALRELDLGSNALRDAGGRAVAHHIFAGLGTWPRLVRLDLSGNGMGDGGVEAVFKAVTAPGASLAPDVERISV